MIRSFLLHMRSSPGDRRILVWMKRSFGVRPADLAVYRQALRHSSAVPEDRPDLPDNERLEFLGDAILDAVVGSMLFQRYPQQGEGFLTRMRSKLVSRQQLSELAKRVEITRVMESNVTRGHETSVPGNALEAVFGAIYLERGFHRAQQAIEKLIISQYDLRELEKEDRDNKSRLLEWGQKHRRQVEFIIAEEGGRGGRGKTYRAEVKVDGELRGTGRGNSKKKAEQDAADAAFRAMEKRRSGGRGRGRGRQRRDGGPRNGQAPNAPSPAE